MFCYKLDKGERVRHAYKVWVFYVKSLKVTLHLGLDFVWNLQILATVVYKISLRVPNHWSFIHYVNWWVWQFDLPEAIVELNFDRKVHVFLWDPFHKWGTWYESRADFVFLLLDVCRVLAFVYLAHGSMGLPKNLRLYKRGQVGSPKRLPQLWNL